MFTFLLRRRVVDVEYLHIVYGHGEVFPLIWAYLDIQSPSLFYESMASTVVWRISKEHFDGNVKRKLSLSNAMSEQLAQQFRIYSDRVDNLEYKNADERVIYRLLFLAGRFGVREGRDIVIDAPITHDMFAHSINLARESVTRSLKRLSDLRLIDNNRRNIRIKDVEALASHLSRPVNLENWGLDTLPKSVNGAASLSWNELRHRFNK